MLLSYTHYERLFRGNIFGKSIIIIHVKNAHLSYHWLILQYVSYLLGCQIMSEIQVYGSTVLSSSFYDTGCDNIQFPLFRLAPNLKVAGLGHNGSRWWYWLSAVVSAAAFADCYSYGNSDFSDAAGDGGVRPYFCIG